MLAELDTRLQSARERVRKAQKLRAKLREAERVLSVESRRASKWSKRAIEEASDVEDLEGLTLTALFARVLGTREERLDKERQEYLAARLESQQCRHSVGVARAEVARLRREVADFADADADYERVLLDKERLLLDARGDEARSLLTLSEDLADRRSDVKELREAIEVGEAAAGELRKVLSHLRGAANWGNWDLLGGGLLTTLAKHSRMDSAREHAEWASDLLTKLQSELLDVDLSTDVSLDIGGLATFADFFLDGLIADWVMQSKIRKASAACEKTLAGVGSVIRACEHRLTEVEQSIDEIGQQRVEVIEQL